MTLSDIFIPLRLTQKNTKMKKAFTIILFMLAALSGQAEVQPTSRLVGTWSGKLNVMGTSLTLVLHLEQADGYVTASLDSPDQGAKGISCSKEFLTDDSLVVKVDMIGATYSARLKDDELEGTFTQRGVSFPLVLSKGVEQLRRPQNPSQPYPYKTEDVTFRNESDGATLAGTLTYPLDFESKKKGTVPVVLMVTGSGQENRDEEIFDHKPFLVIADHLARHGIASLRYDDRAFGASVGGDIKNATTEHFMRDAAAGIEYLRQLKTFGTVGCLGHSEGGAIAFMLAARKQADFIVLLAAPGVKGDTLLAEQVNLVMKQSGRPAAMTAKAYRQQATLQQSPWLKWFVDYDPTDNIRHTTCPVMALNGEHDCQVPSAQNLPVIRQLLPPSEKNLIKEYPSLNHLFQHCTTGMPTEYRQIEETISPEVLNDISAWINATIAR